MSNQLDEMLTFEDFVPYLKAEGGRASGLLALCLQMGPSPQAGRCLAISRSGAGKLDRLQNRRIECLGDS